MAFLVELAAFLRAHCKAWLRPLLVMMLIAAGLALFANELPRIVSSPAQEGLTPISHDDYRHDDAWLNRY